MVRFTRENTKLKKLYSMPELDRWLTGKRKIYKFDLLAGHTCPYAKDCYAKAVIVNGTRRIKDGKDMKFRCYAASLEVLRRTTYELHEANTLRLRKLKTKPQLVNELSSALPHKAGIVRIHTSGDFYNQAYFDAWVQVAKSNPTTLFYAYTKNNKVWVNRLGSIPENLVLTASVGGRLDHMVTEHGLRSATVVYSVSEAVNLGLEIDDTDSHAAVPEWFDDDFALLIHGVQPAGSEAGKAVSALKGKGSYGKKVMA